MEPALKFGIAEGGGDFPPAYANFAGRAGWQRDYPVPLVYKAGDLPESKRAAREVLRGAGLSRAFQFGFVSRAAIEWMLAFNRFVVQGSEGYYPIPEPLNIGSGSIVQLVLNSVNSTAISAPVSTSGFTAVGGD